MSAPELAAAVLAALAGISLVLLIASAGKPRVRVRDDAAAARDAMRRAENDTQDRREGPAA